MSRILVVEDDDNTRRAVEKYLTGSGYEVYPAANGWEALLILDNQQVDLIVLDLVMPGMDGQTFLHILRNGRKYPRVPVIVLTAFDVEEMRKLLQSTDVFCVLGKRPPLWDDLLPAVKNALAAA